ncbi:MULTISPECIES: hypothetical protein [unclassified Bacillus (in: firmicutes)]|uniref:hypothetical protein n=1 Tax=unclassified Bacillus (in: firmicutes) TaxID=185979 RepID=UPI0008E917DB|nr:MULTISPECIES: hypothetical protein [unclassified Bacillus (in: firmicutes)]SFB19836.1 hypothetical protein SAMN02799634_10837 [Bacillus sp. UNCCL13]SFQ90760.1 hypothetical protein SAMN04488577_3853 [Bacillus sp. cl95]
MKKSFMIISALLLLLTGCGTTDLQEELVSYINDEMPKLGEKEEAVLSAYDSVTGANYTDDPTTYAVLKDEVIPQYTDFIDDLESVKIDSDELSALHEDYIAAANLQHSAFVLILEAIENQDLAQITEANEMLAEARKAMRKYQQDVEKLCEENDVTLEKK